MIRVIIIEDNQSTRDSLLFLLEHSPDIKCIGDYDSAENGERAISRLEPDVAIVDIHLPGRGGIDCVARLKGEHPNVEFMILTAYNDRDLVFQALKVGATGYLLKRDASEKLVDAIRQLHAGGAPMSIEIAGQVITHFYQSSTASVELDELSVRERQILELLAGGASYKSIAAKLEISPHTVHNHLKKVYVKLHVSSRTEAVIRFLRR